MTQDFVERFAPTPQTSGNGNSGAISGAGAAAGRRSATSREAAGAVGLSEPDGDLMRMRNDAMENFRALGVPTMKNEDWHFTSLQPLLSADLSPGIAESRPMEATALLARVLGGDSWPTVVLLNGRYVEEISSLGTLPAGVSVVPFARAGDKASIVKKWLGKVASTREHAFTALNTAHQSEEGGVLVHVAHGSEMETPIRIAHLTTSSGAGGTTHPRVLIVAEANARASVLESFVGAEGTSYFTNAVTEVVVEQGATVHHFKVQRESREAFHIGTSEAHQARDSHYISFSYATGARLSRTNIYTVLDGEGAGSTLNGLYMVDGVQHVDHQTRIEHAQPNCFSREVYKGILDGSSHGVFNGKVYVHPIAQKTDGKQSNNNLLLSEKARIDTKPQLEIFADDVKCTHGATVGRIDEMALFYLKSRGLKASTARELLTYAFAAEVLEEIEVPLLRDQLEEIALKARIKE